MPATLMCNYEYTCLPLLKGNLMCCVSACLYLFNLHHQLPHFAHADSSHEHSSTHMLQVAVHRVMQVPDVRVAFLSVMSALASGPKGVRFILMQFRENANRPELEHLTWRKLFKTIVDYCGR